MYRAVRRFAGGSCRYESRKISREASKWQRQNVRNSYASTRTEWPSCGGIFDVDVKREKLTQLENRMAERGFWDDQHSAQRVVQQVKALKGLVDPFDKLSDRVKSAQDL